MAVYWIGGDGNIWYKGDDGKVVNRGSSTDFNPGGKLLDAGVSGHRSGSFAATRIADPNPQQPAAQNTGGGGGGGGGYSAPAVDPDAAQRNALKSRIGGRGGEIEAAYAALFGDLEGLLRSRDSELESQYGDQLKKASETYTGALPEIEGSYAAIGAGDSTDQSDSKTKAKKGFEDTTKTIGSNKQKDKAALGQYGNEQRAKFSADKDSAMRAINSAAETTDVSALRGLDNDLSGNLSQTGVTRATLGTDAGARGAITALTNDNGRYDAAINALDSIIKSSMSGAVKSAAVEAITSAGGLNDTEKKKIQEQYGNVYAEQAAL
jgi:hypothetical protein